MAVEPHFYVCYRRGRAVGTVSNERWKVAQGNAMPTQNCKAKSLNGGLGVLFREGDKKEKRPRSSREQIHGGMANYV